MTADSTEQSVECEICGCPVGPSYMVYSPLWSPKGITTGQRTILRCGECGHLNIPEGPPPESYYEESVYRGAWDKPGYEEYFGRLKRMIAPGSRILDIGCNDATYLKRRFSGFKLFGVEPSRYAAAKAARSGVEIIGGRVEQVPKEFEGRFAAVLALDVIVHVPDVRNFVARVHSLVQPGGLFLIETACADSMCARMLGRSWYYTRLREHLRAFSRNSIRIALEPKGFAVFRMDIKSHLGGRVYPHPLTVIRLLLDVIGLDRKLKGAIGPGSVPILDHMFVWARKKPTQECPHQTTT